MTLWSRVMVEKTNKQKKKEGEFKKKHKESKMHIKGYRKELIFT